MLTEAAIESKSDGAARPEGEHHHRQADPGRHRQLGLQGHRDVGPRLPADGLLVAPTDEDQDIAEWLGAELRDHRRRHARRWPRSSASPPATTRRPAEPTTRLQLDEQRRVPRALGPGHRSRPRRRCGSSPSGHRSEVGRTRSVGTWTQRARVCEDRPCTGGRSSDGWRSWPARPRSGRAASTGVGRRGRRRRARALRPARRPRTPTASSCPPGFTSRRDRPQRPAGRRHRLRVAPRPRRRRVLRRRRRRLGLRVELARSPARPAAPAPSGSLPTARSRGATASSTGTSRELRRRRRRRGARGCPARRTASAAASTSAIRSSRARASAAPRWARSPTRPRPSTRRTGHVYLTEDDPTGRLYRFVPTTPGDLSAGSLDAASVSGTVGRRGCRSSAVGPRPRSASDDRVQRRRGRVDRRRHAVVHHQGRRPGVGARPRDPAAHHPLRRLHHRRRAAHRRRQHHRARAVRRPLRGRGRRQPRAVPHHHADAQDVVAPFLRLVGHSGSEITGPAFSPDGTRLYFSSQRGTDGRDRHHLRGHRAVPHRPDAAPAAATVAGARCVRALGGGGGVRRMSAGPGP